MICFKFYSTDWSNKVMNSVICLFIVIIKLNIYFSLGIFLLCHDSIWSLSRDLAVDCNNGKTERSKWWQWSIWLQRGCSTVVLLICDLRNTFPILLFIGKSFFVMAPYTTAILEICVYKCASQLVHTPGDKIAILRI